MFCFLACVSTTLGMTLVSLFSSKRLRGSLTEIENLNFDFEKQIIRFHCFFAKIPQSVFEIRECPWNTQLVMWSKMFHLQICTNWLVKITLNFEKELSIESLPYFIEYNVHTSIVRTWISQKNLAKKLFLFFKNNFTRINHWIIKAILNPFLATFHV